MIFAKTILTETKSLSMNQFVCNMVVLYTKIIVFRKEEVNIWDDRRRYNTHFRYTRSVSSNGNITLHTIIPPITQILFEFLSVGRILLNLEGPQ